MYPSKTRVLDSAALQRRIESTDNPLQLFKQTLNESRAVLEEYHRQGLSAQAIVENNAWLIDQVLILAWRDFLRRHPLKRSPSLIAVGGYGRGELNIHSDIDLLLLLSSAPDKATEAFVEDFIRFLWDIGLQVGHSVRTLKQCLESAHRDLTVLTALMETRLISGDEKLLRSLQKKVRSPRTWSLRSYFQDKVTEQQERHQRYEDTAYNLEPNVKEGPGGLRDIQTISWVANRYFGTGDLAELVEQEFLTEPEHRALIKGRNFLWRVRNGLHILSGRAEDRLLFDYQRDLAAQFGYRDRGGHLGVELMMTRYYRTVKELGLLNEILLQHFQEAILSSGRHRMTRINRRFRGVDDFLEVADEQVFENHPIALLELFYILQQQPELKGVRASTIRLLRANLHRIDADYRKQRAHRSLFLDIFRHQEGLTHALRRMNAYGVLGAFIPDFGRIVGQMQHDLFHVYTVDAHSLFVVRNLRRLAMPQHKGEFPLLSELLARTYKRERLYLAALFHDIAKGRGGNHAQLGGIEALAFCRQLGMSDFDARFVAWLVRNHLVMSTTAQREDISDPAVVARFAETMGNQEHLDNLYLLTVADIRGTSPTVWNAWKGRLLSDLYAAATRALRRGVQDIESLEERASELKKEVYSLLAGKVQEEKIRQLWDVLDEDYFMRHNPGSVAWHTEAACGAGIGDLPLAVGRFREDFAAEQYLIVAPDSENLLLGIAGGFDQLNLNIVDARIHQTRSGLALVTLIAIDPAAQDDVQGEHVQGEDAQGEDVQSNVALKAKQLREHLLNPASWRQPKRRPLPRKLKQFPIQTRVVFVDDANAARTTMEVVAQDRPGLLYSVALALLECKVKLATAKISTVGEKAEDTFFITDRDGLPVDSEQQKNCLRDRLHAYLTPPETKA